VRTGGSGQSLGKFSADNARRSFNPAGGREKPAKNQGKRQTRTGQGRLKCSKGGLSLKEIARKEVIRGHDHQEGLARLGGKNTPAQKES